jgi:hypothetical protein
MSSEGLVEMFEGDFLELVGRNFDTELNYAYVLDRQVLDRGGGPQHEEAGCMLCYSPGLCSWMCQN